MIPLRSGHQHNPPPDIPLILQQMHGDKQGADFTKAVYNEAIDDAANFVRHLAAFNPAHAATLLAAQDEIRKWLPLP
jgi:hypothetical protein